MASLTRKGYNALWREALVAVEPGQGWATFRLCGQIGLEERVRDLTRREHECCSFFTFALSGADNNLTLQVTVPAAHVDVLSTAVSRAEEFLA